MGFGFDLSDVAIRARAIAILAGLFAIAISWTQLESVFLLSPDALRVLDADTPSEVCTALLMSFGFAAALAQALRHRAGKLFHPDWAWVAAGVGLVAAIETGDWFSDAIDDHFWFEGFWVQVPAWLFAAFCVHRCTRLHRDDWRIARWFRAGIACQIVFSILATINDVLGAGTLGYVMDAVVDHASVLIALCYVPAILLCIVTPSTVRPRWEWAAVAPASLRLGPAGAPAATVHTFFRDELPRRHSGIDRLTLVGIRVVWPLAVIGLALWATWHNGRVTRQRVGRVVPLQFLDQVRLGLMHSLPPPWYYVFALAERGPRQRITEYLLRFETKGIAYEFLKRVNGGCRASSLSDKASFVARCEAGGVPVLSVVAVITARGSEGATPDLPHEDPFIKDAGGKGGRAAMRGGLVQLRARNHPALADLALDELATVRMMTIRNEVGAYELTDAVFRMPRGPAAPVGNIHAVGIAASVDIISGTLASASDIGLHTAAGWLDEHPYSGARIHGRALPFWAECRTLVRQAHAQFPEHVAVGWDVAILVEGPVIVEGNGSPDLGIIQRMAQRPIGNTRYGELLAYNLRRAVSERSARLFTRGDNDNA